ncbi:MAG: putative peptidoglycan glycosyl transferase, Ftsi [Rhodospirillales bacterium]|jgi:cell division protein FtsI (penicillin-binding protein 3)|nr:putative peptidoglycan glycosyl transferase, Ftsi [Rhodospirillales bacterium]
MKIERIEHPEAPRPETALVTQAPVEIPNSVAFAGVRAHALEVSRNRMVVTAALITLAFVVIAGRLVELTAFRDAPAPVRVAQKVAPKERADIVDRNGVLLATSLPMASLYANPKHVIDHAQAADRLAQALPDLKRDVILKRLNSEGTFVWLHRNLTPEQQFRVNALGIPGFYFQKTERRVYPHGNLVSHIMGLTDVDGAGLSGLEKSFNENLQVRSGVLTSSIDIRIQSVLREELFRAMKEFQAIGATGIVMDVHTGEVLAMSSLPDFDPNNPGSAVGDAAFNRATKGVYEMGSTMKLFTAAVGFDMGTTDINRRYDASTPIHMGRFTIRDYHAKNRTLSVPEIMIYSSNIGAAKMALEFGTATQRRYLDSFGFLKPAQFELPEVGKPLSPAKWRDINTITISYGHGLAVSPLQVITATAAISNGGILPTPTLIRREDDTRRTIGKRVVTRETSRQMRQLMRMVVEDGTGKTAEVPGYLIGGKTGTADKAMGRGYSQRKIISSFVGVFPTDEPEYAVIAILDEPKGTKKTFGYATGGWVAAPMVHNIVAQMAPIMGIVPSDRVAAEAAEAKKQKANKTKAIMTARASETKPDSRVKGQTVATQ